MLKYFKMFIGIMHIYIISYNVQANPPTTPPESLFRIDSRTSHAIFQTGFISHGDNFNFYQHTYGQSNIVSSLDGRPPNDGWISSSLSEERSISYLRDRIESGMFQPGTYWLYEFTPPSGSYSFEITVEEALARYHRGEQNFNNAELEALNTFSTYFNMGEWLVRSHIPSNYISSAIPITIDEDGDIVYGETEINAAFDSGIPSFATLDPLMELGRIYDETSDNSIAGVANFGDSTPASFMLCDINSSRRINNTGNCSAIKKPPHIVTRHQADTLLNNVSARNSDLKINYYGRQYCLKPNSYFYVDYCEYTPMGRFTSEGQIQFNDENSNNIAWCVTMPSNVESSNFTWDYLRIDLCDINNDYQKFKLDPNSFELTSVISGVKVQIWEWYLIAAKPGYYGYDFSFKKQGNIKFGTTPYFRQEEININYQKDGQVWYPKSNDSGTIDSTNNSQRNFHDTGSDQIKQKFGDSILCLQEDSIKGPGINSVSWSECSKTSTSQKWFFEKNKDGSNIITNANNNILVTWNGAWLTTSSKIKNPKFIYNFFTKSDNPVVVIYEDKNQQGHELNVSKDIPSLFTYKFNDKMSSWFIPHGWKIRFYEDVNYRGRYYTRGAGQNNADGFYKKISSIKILKKQG